MTEVEEQPPELIPARMLNEFVYCPRLFYLEWADGRWADNADTTGGTISHSSIDSRGGRMPVPDAEAPPAMTASVRIADESLGVIAVIDRVDHRDGTCSPVDYKVGHPAPGDQPWPADRAQVLVQAALLHQAGYSVSSAELYYRETHQRVHVPWSDESLAEVRQLVSGARSVAEKLSPPLPLVDSGRCPRCSLVGLCLPDETNALLDRSNQPPRRLMPRNPDQAPLYVTEQGSSVGVRGNQVVVTKGKEVLASHRLIDVAQLSVFGHVQVSTEALGKLWSAGAPVLWFSYGGWLKGWAQGQPSKYVELRRRQVALHSQGSAAAAQIVAGKIRNQRTLLRRNVKDSVDAALTSLADLSRQAESADSLGSLLGIEGTAARLYFDRFPAMLVSDPRFAESFAASGRNRRPPLDPVNALLSFCYSLLVRDLVAACLAVGLDPFLGVLHRDRYGRPSLALDLAEEFRPLIADSVVLGLINRREIEWADFRISPVGVELTGAGRKKVLAAYERRMATEIRHPLFGYRVSYRRCIDVQTRVFAAVVIGEVPRYVPMVTR
jgi:CRISPR-associated protein Cas1